MTITLKVYFTVWTPKISSDNISNNQTISVSELHDFIQQNNNETSEITSENSSNIQ